MTNGSFAYEVIGPENVRLLEGLSFSFASKTALKHPLIRTFYYYWESKLGDRKVPLKKQIDPVEIPSLLEYISLAEYDPSTSLYRFLNVGSHIVKKYGYEISWHPFSAAGLGNAYDSFVQIYDYVRETGEPVFFSGSLYWSNRVFYRFDEVLLPLSRTGDAIDCFGACTVFSD